MHSGDWMSPLQQMVIQCVQRIAFKGESYESTKRGTYQLFINDILVYVEPLSLSCGSCRESVTIPNVSNSGPRHILFRAGQKNYCIGSMNKSKFVITTQTMRWDSKKSCVFPTGGETRCRNR